MRTMDIGPWLERIYPEIQADSRPGTPFPAHIKTRGPEHNPPLFWLGRALDAVEEGGQIDRFIEMAREALGDPGAYDWDAEQRVQDVFSQACAFAWSAAHLGPPEFSAAADGSAMISVAAHDAVVAPRRIHPQESMDETLEAIAGFVEESGAALPAAAGRILYLDTYLNLRFYAQDLGYRLELTEPLIATVRHFSGDTQIGHVLTRPFQWGNPVDSWY
jgi:hypothetical protein